MRGIITKDLPRRSSTRLATLATAALLFAACDRELADAYGNFESVEVAVAAEATGPLVRFDVQEGTMLEAGATVAQVDTVQLSLQKKELEVQRLTARTRGIEAAATVRSLEAQLGTAEEDFARTERLFANNVATAAELNRLEGSVASLGAQVAGARARVELSSLEEATVAARLEQLQDRLDRATVHNPVSGTVLTTFVEHGEYVQQGRTLYSIAPLDTLVLRAYVSGGQLSRLVLGGSVGVRFDEGDGTLAQRTGRLSWISPAAEFTPTPIQTREERVDQVYAVKVLVPNQDGRLKIGMPGELVLPGALNVEQP